jgi:hypothetical protein
MIFCLGRIGRRGRSGHDSRWDLFHIQRSLATMTPKSRASELIEAQG